MLHASGEEAVGAAIVPGNTLAVAEGGRTAPNMSIVKGARKGAKGDTKEQKWQPHHVAVVAAKGGSDKGASGSDEERIATAERDLKRQTRPPKDHFEKLLETTCLHHSYPVKHKLKDCTMIKKFMTSAAFSKDRKPGRDPGGKSAVPIPGEAEVMTIFDRPHRGPGNAT
jgi:hypothetical protein